MVRLSEPANRSIPIVTNFNIYFCFKIQQQEYIQNKPYKGQMFAKNKQKFKREDFLFENGWFQTAVKLPGSLAMQQFQISDCEQCQIYILDSNAGVFIDDCKYCTIFIGPSQSSIFIRDCHYLNIVCLTQQFRVRDSTSCNFWLWCESQPVIESSHHLTFTYFPSQVGYTTLVGQMKEARLKLWNNNWFNIYDFTPNKYSIQNHQCVDKISNMIVEKVVLKIRSLGLQTKQEIIPLCLGTESIAQKQIGKYAVVIVNPIPNQSVGLPILHSRTAPLPKSLQYNNTLHNQLFLFIKIKLSEIQKWQRLNPTTLTIKQMVTKPQTLQLLQTTVFVPFADER